MTTSEIETAQQWDDEWWRLWEVARADKLDGEASAGVADREMSERHGRRPDELAVGGVLSVQQRRAVRCQPDPVELMVDWLANGNPIELTRWQADALLAQADVGACAHPRRGWLGRWLDRVFG